ncbi:MAG: ABC transporter permease [Deltaproteobacteria bacterium GWA2_38_16]|nr:MAG: ABC transporter permease [Deltaproteobacteria bacterium GWA2_38_16]OGQ01976.1 MAG: ABC transporter permease [Deltaproteobacteria bacterium RIFCSPHIGHO2_02_FULL_38_15]OGQ33671.1 MAG: ABC transporter permease [Deltaproteobacteria bacterium RIFCSPLOWO2_01_FULL_38_9]HBQ21509.1 branched-chain amino acid ABC transporter permease [Deltaproteobacteria bacterium]
MEEFLQHIINGISLGSIYGLIALGYTMVYGILKLINFAHGDVYMMGAFFGFFFAHWLGFSHAPSTIHGVIVLVLAMAACGALGFTIERFAYRPLRQMPRLNLLITAIGVSLFLENGGQILFGADPKFFPELIERIVLFRIGNISISNYQVIVIGVSLALMILLQYIIFHTKTGKAMQAVSFSHEKASLMGINTDRIISFTFVLGSALAAAAGILVGLSYPRIDPLMGIMFGLKAFVAAVLGGIGSIPGAIVGALLMGLSEEMVIGYLSSTYRDALAFCLLILILLIKPTGLFGKTTSEKV